MQIDTEAKFIYNILYFLEISPWQDFISKLCFTVKNGVYSDIPTRVSMHTLVNKGILQAPFRVCNRHEHPKGC